MNGNNPVNLADVYPFAGGATTAAEGSQPFQTSDFGAPAGTPDASTIGAAQPGTVDHAASIGAQGEPVRWWVTLLILLLVLMYSARKFGKESEYANIQLSAYNIFVTTLAAIIGISLFKTLFTKFPVPGLTTIIQAV